jgi:hypothetical protein
MIVGLTLALDPPPDLAAGEEELAWRTTHTSVDDPDEHAFLRDHRLGKAGVVLYFSGIGATVVGAALVTPCAASTVTAANGADETVCYVGASMAVAGVLTSLTGETLLFYGAIASNNDLGLSPALGWMGVGLAVASVPVTAVLPPVGVGMHLGGLVLGAVHLGHAGHVGRERDLVLVPRPNGLAVAGSF